MRYQKWIDNNLDDLTNKTIVVTGANSGIGYYIALYLAYKNANIILACRNLNKAKIAKDKIIAKYPKANLTIEELNLASLESIDNFVAQINNKYEQLDGLVNNAGIYNMPRGAVTADNFEITMGTNYLGPYALTCKLIPLLNKCPSRIINVSSVAHRNARINYEDFFASNARRIVLYARSKLALLTFSEYLGNYCQLNHPNIMVAAAHPGVSATNIFAARSGGFSVWFAKLASSFLKIFTHSPNKACFPIVYAMASSKVKNNDYYGPRGLYEISGYPTKARKSKNVYVNQDLLIKQSEELTGISLP